MRARRAVLSYRLLVVGRRARDPLLEALDDYVERLGRYARVELVRVREGTPALEHAALSRLVRDDDLLVALDERGVQPSTKELATTVAAWQKQHRPVALVVGGAGGLHADLVARATMRLSLSRLTLPHRLAQVLLAEQLYRAHTILRGERYHRA